jgi:hypothetical protein
VLESHSNGCQNKKKRGETRPPGSIPIRMYVLCVAEYDGCGNSQQKKKNAVESVWYFGDWVGDWCNHGFSARGERDTLSKDLRVRVRKLKISI